MASAEYTSAPGGSGPGGGNGETFSINLSTGTASHAVPLPVPDGVAGHTPRLTLQYDAGGGLGELGLGWSLGLRAITAGVDLGAPDGGRVLRLLDTGAEIVPSADGTYRLLRETVFDRYTRLGDGWRIEQHDGLVHELGTTPAARVADPDHPDRVVEWRLERTLDVNGNAIAYTYLTDDGCAYVASIAYARYEVRFAYEDRPDVRHDGRSGFSRRRRQRCRLVSVVLDPGPAERTIRSWALGYAVDPTSGVSLLTSVGLVSHGAAADGSDDVRRTPVTFGYTAFDVTAFRATIMTAAGAAPPPLTDPDTALVTLDDAPLPGVLVNRGGREQYWPNDGAGGFGVPRPLVRAPLTSTFAQAGLAFVDMDGSGTADLMTGASATLTGYYENDGSDGWGALVKFPRGAAAGPSWADPTLRLLDADGDGLIDAMTQVRGGVAWWRNGGRSGWADPELALSPGLADVDLADPDVHLADMTGDGLADVVRVRSGLVEYWPSLGRGRFGDRVVMTGAPRISRDTPWATSVLTDVDGDGCADLVLLSSDGITVLANRNGTALGAPTRLPLGPPPLPGTVAAVNLTGAPTAGLVWNARGTAGAFRYVQWSSPAQPAYLLDGVDNGSGLTSALTYRAAVEDRARDRAQGRLWTTNFPFPYVVVGALLEMDAVTGRRTEVELRYHEAHFETRTRQFQGFRSTERITTGDVSRADTREVHTFVMAAERAPGGRPADALLNGLLERVEVYSDDGSPLAASPYSVETCTHDVAVLDVLPDGRERALVRVTGRRIEDTERGDDSRIEATTYSYDDLGRVVREERHGSGRVGGVPAPELAEVRTTEYAVSATHYRLDRIARAARLAGDGSLLAERRQHHDGADFVGLTLGQADRGLVTRELELVLTVADFAAHYGVDPVSLGFVVDADVTGRPAVFAPLTRSRYDARGLALATQDPMGQLTTTTFDDAGLFRVGRADPLGTSSFVFDAPTGQVTEVHTPDGNVSRFAYDAQGRVLATALPGEDLADPATSYSFDESSVPHRRTAHLLQADGTRADHVTYYDGEGKEVQQRATVSPGRVVVSGWHVLNPWGDVEAEYEPTFADSLEFAVPALAGAPSRTFAFDGRGRPLRSVNYNGGVSTAQYAPFEVTSRDADDNDDSPENVARGQFDTPHVERFDAFRNLTQVMDVIDAATADTTTYTVSAAGDLLSVADDRGVRLAYAYDARHCRLAIDSREAGSRRISYDAAKRAVRSVDGSGHDIAATWDAVGRLLSLVSGGTTLEAYTYDTAAQRAFGRLASVSYPGGSQQLSYDQAGRLTAQSYAFDGDADVRRIGYEYDPCGRQTAVVHADGHRVEQTLTANGWVASISGVLTVERDARGFPTDVAYANGAATRYEHTPGPGRISRQVTTSASGVVLEDVAFTYDKLETLLGTDDVAPGGAGARTYEYDPLYQLTGATSVEDGSTVTQRYLYTAHRNLSRLDESRSTLAYDDAAHPDRLAGVTVDGQPRFAVTHDDGGNVTALPGLTFAYDAKNELVGLRTDAGVTAVYGYDHWGMRVSKVVDDGHGTTRTTRFLSTLAEIRDGVVTDFVTMDGARVAAVTAGSVLFLHNNPTGTTVLFTDGTGERVGSRDPRPFGNDPRDDGTVDFATFGEHPVDPESGLVYMRRRYYAPSIGRFLTPDLMTLHQPDQFLHHPAGLQLYAYVANDPLNQVDPTGLDAWSIIGAVVGIAAGVAAGLFIIAATGGIGLLAFGIILAASLVVTTVSYIAASNVDPNSWFGQFMRGFMIGFNAGLNFAAGSAILGGGALGYTVGSVIGVVNALAAIDGVARNSFYQGVLGWTSWVMPMSWAANGIGLAIYLFNWIASGARLTETHINLMGFDWKTGTLVMKGGLIRNGGAFSVGHFVFMDPSYVTGTSPDNTYDAVLRHETGHTLEVGAFGSAFLVDDFFGQNVTGGGVHDYGEEIAESHSNRPGRPTIPMWG